MSSLRKLIELIRLQKKAELLTLFSLFIVGMFLETLGVGAVIPAIAIMTQPNIDADYPELAPLLEYLGNPNQVELITIGVLILVSVYVFKSVFLVLMYWYQARFTYTLVAGLSQRLFVGYVYQSYTFHLQRNSAQLIRNATTELNTFATAVLAFMSTATEVLVLVGISILLLMIEPVGAISVMLIMLSAGYFFHYLTKERILQWGKKRQYYEGLRIQHLQQGIGGAKDVKLLGREREFCDQYEKHNFGSADMSRRQTFMQTLPRLWLEVLAVCGLSILIIVMLYRGKPVETLLPTLGLFGAAAFRLMPSANRIITGIQKFRYALPVVDLLYDEFNLIDKKESTSGSRLISFNQSLKLEGVCFSYPNASDPALSDINIDIACGSSVGIIGGSGAGKSTLIDIILGLLVPSKGEVRVDNVDISGNLRGWQDHIGYVPQTIYLTDDTLRRNIAFGLPDDQIDDDAVFRAIKMAQLEDFVRQQDKGLDLLVGERGVRLSGGQRQRIGIARALYHDPEVLVLDEATSALDLDTEQGVIDSVSALQGEKTIIVVAHRLSTVERCDHLFRIDKGCVVEEGNFEKVVQAT